MQKKVKVVPPLNINFGMFYEDSPNILALGIISRELSRGKKGPKIVFFMNKKFGHFFTNEWLNITVNIY